ncbi:hypothetical protein BpHYR1_010763 [Brachionus plicatilis]|uniref:Uncharacterized protein n=1 Tax=Brachionus plicatilis TaxID=10195 RepID=A0A3M7QN14_BRAPC|nr:hypothetical protein BpHYR1_010763 [Brachionus plicatilis]
MTYYYIKLQSNKNGKLDLQKNAYRTYKSILALKINICKFPSLLECSSKLLSRFDGGSPRKIK